MNVTIRQLRAFTALARAGSFTRAAASMHITQSALSGLIKELETQVGVKLVDRSTRRTRLSQTGLEFHSVATRLLKDLDCALDSIDDLKRLRRGVVRVAAPQLLASTLIPHVIASFLGKYPDVHVRLVDCGGDNPLTLTLRGEVDICVNPHREEISGLEADFLFDLPFMAVFQASHPFSAQAQIAWSDFVRAPVISLQGRFTSQLSIDLQRFTHVPTIRPSYEVGFMSTALSMVNAGLGVAACLPYAQALADLYGLQTRPLIDPEIRRQFFIYRRPHTSLSPATETFVHYLHEHMGDRSWDLAGPLTNSPPPPHGQGRAGGRGKVRVSRQRLALDGAASATSACG